MDRIYRIALRGIEYLSIGLLLATSAIIVIQVFFRYVLNSSISWSDEVMGFLLVWLTFTGAVLAMHDNSHIGIDILAEMVPLRMRLFVNILIDACIMLFLVVFTWAASLLCMKMFDNYAISLEIRMSYIYSILPLAGVFMIVSVVRRIAHEFSSVVKKGKREGL